MKVLTDISEKEYQLISNGVVYVHDWIRKLFINGILIPSYATNGDALKTMFPDAHIEKPNVDLQLYFMMIFM